MPKKTVAIVGSHPKTRMLAPWTRKYIDIWVFNEAGSLNWPQRVSGVFQMHMKAIWNSEINRNDPTEKDEKYKGAMKHCDWLRLEHPFPIYMLDKYKEVPACVKYPLDEICDELLPNFWLTQKKRKKKSVRQFSNSVSYALALAIYQGYERIDVFGVEMETGTEWAHQKPNLFMFLGIALGRGIEVNFRNESGVLKDLLYGYEGGIVIERQEFEGQARVWGQKILDVEAELRRAEAGSKMALDVLYKSKDPKVAEKNAALYIEALQVQITATLKFGVAQGVFQENRRYMNILDERIKAAGGDIAIEALSNLEIKEHAKVDGQSEAILAEIKTQAVSDLEDDNGEG